jgi:hypothetical protein
MNFDRDERLDVPCGVRVDESRVSCLFRQVIAAASDAAHR